MSELMKKHLINDQKISIWIGDKDVKLYLLPKKKAKALSQMLEEYESEKTMPWRNVLGDFINQTGQQAVVLRASRREKRMSQKELARILEVDQSFISKIENGTKSINRSLAKKLAKIFDTDYKLFL